MDKDGSSVSSESSRDPQLLSTSSGNAVAAQERIFQLQETVFGNSLIFKEIIHHCLHCTVDSDFHHTDNETSLSTNEAKSLRLVNSTWWKETNQIFLRRKIPLLAFKIILPISTINVGPTLLNFTSLEMVKYFDFLMSLLDGPLEQTPLPFALSFIILEPLRYPVDIWHFQNIFSKNWLISSLVKITFRTNGRYTHTCCPEVTSNLKLPCLKELNIYYKAVSQIDKFLNFINAVLNAALSLKKLILEVPVSNDNTYWTLPRTLTHLRIYSEGILKRLTTINKSKPSAPIFLPKLKMLEVCGNQQPLIGTLDIPTMSKLVSTMAHLEKIKLCRMSEGDLKNNWCHLGWNNWPTVKTLLVYDFLPRSHDYMASIHKSFPSVVHFDLHIIFDHQMPPLEEWSSQLRYLFQEMRNLKSLKLNMWRMKYSQEYVMDSIFLGVSTEKATQLRQNPTLWDNFLKQGQQGEQQKRSGGIKNFQFLKSLHLNCINDYTPHDAIPYDLRPPTPGIISPLVFRLGFMQLPHLENLILENGFSIGMAEIGDEWKKQSPTTRKLLL